MTYQFNCEIFDKIDYTNYYQLFRWSQNDKITKFDIDFKEVTK